MAIEQRPQGHQYARSLLLFVAFCLLIVVMAAWEIKRIHQDVYARTAVRLQNDALLVSEWVKGAFQTSDYLLRDVVTNFLLSSCCRIAAPTRPPAWPRSCAPCWPDKPSMASAR